MKRHTTNKKKQVTVLDESNPNFRHLTVKDAMGRDIQNVTSFNLITGEVGICPVVMVETQVGGVMFNDLVGASDKDDLCPVVFCQVKGAKLANRYWNSVLSASEVEQLKNGETLYSMV